MLIQLETVAACASWTGKIQQAELEAILAAIIVSCQIVRQFDSEKDLVTKVADQACIIDSSSLLCK